MGIKWSKFQNAMKKSIHLLRAARRPRQILGFVNQLRSGGPNLYQLGKQLRDAARPIVVSILGMKFYPGKQEFLSERPTLIVVTHEASSTGAPILAWNLCQYLYRDYNVLVLLLRPGPMIPDFQEYSLGVLRARQQLVMKRQLQHEFQRLIGTSNPEVAIINSIVSHPFIKPLRSLGIATVSLIHEFPSSLRPSNLLTEITNWSTRIVFSSDLTRDDLYIKEPHLDAVRTAVIAQGPCKRPNRPGRVAAVQPQLAGVDAEEFLTGLKDSTFLVLGAGEVTTRKGVDLFIAVCERIKKQCPGVDLKFAWMGAGYNPLYDTEVSLWLYDQIQRSGLTECLIMLEHSSGYKEVLNRSDLFIISSRLDPLPNVAIDALLRGKPVLCFANACGIANILLQDPKLGKAWTSPYLDVATMANQASEMILHPQQRAALTEHSLEMAKHWFDMPSYLQRLSEVADQATTDVQREQSTMTQLMQANIIDPSFSFGGNTKDFSTATLEFVLAWRQEIWPRKPYAGFHPGIYREQRLKGEKTIDPTLHFHQSGRPDGEWKCKMLPESRGESNPTEICSKVAIHLHLTKHWKMAPILDAISLNQTPTDVFVTSSDPSIESWLAYEHEKRGLTLREHHIVPRRGRDVAALFLGVLDRLENEYEFYGHFHTDTHLGICASNPHIYQQFLLAHLLGTEKYRQMDNIVRAFRQDPHLGLVYPCDPVCFHSGGHTGTTNQLAQQMNIPDPPRWQDFPTASMFWARRGSFRGMHKLNLDWQDYPSDLFDPEAPFLIALQELLPTIVMHSNRTVRQTNIPGVSR